MKYELPDLNYGYGDLDPVISEQQLMLHHQKHHQGYVNNANDILEKLDSARDSGEEVDQKNLLKNLSFNLSGHMLHTWFWENLKKPTEDNKPERAIYDKITADFSSWDRFKQEFTASAISVEGSGWAALVQDHQSNKLTIMQIEKHSQNTYPDVKYLLVVDVWEHAYYLDYQNERGKFIDEFWKIVDWDIVNKRLV
jgi:Fe-Mn family superoxide dismutase